MAQFAVLTIFRWHWCSHNIRRSQVLFFFFFFKPAECSPWSPVMRCSPNAHPRPAFPHPDARGSRSAVSERVELEGAAGRSRRWAGTLGSAQPLVESGVRGSAPPAVWARCGDARGQQGELQGNFSQGKRPVVLPRSLPAFCLFSCRRLERGRVPAAHHAPRGPRLSPAPSGVPKSTPRSVLAGIAPLPPLLPRRPRACPRRSRAPLRGGPPPILAALVSGVGG